MSIKIKTSTDEYIFGTMRIPTRKQPFVFIQRDCEVEVLGYLKNDMLRDTFDKVLDDITQIVEGLSK